MEIGQNRANGVGSLIIRAAAGGTNTYRPGLAKVAADGRGAQGHFCIMIPNFGMSLARRCGRSQESRLLCGRSQIFAGYYGSRKNLAFAIEPAANPIRPT